MKSYRLALEIGRPALPEGAENVPHSTQPLRVRSIVNEHVAWLRLSRHKEFYQRVLMVPRFACSTPRLGESAAKKFPSAI